MNDDRAAAISAAAALTPDKARLLLVAGELDAICWGGLTPAECRREASRLASELRSLTRPDPVKLVNVGGLSNLTYPDSAAEFVWNRADRANPGGEVPEADRPGTEAVGTPDVSSAYVMDDQRTPDTTDRAIRYPYRGITAITLAPGYSVTASEIEGIGTFTAADGAPRCSVSVTIGGETTDWATGSTAEEARAYRDRLIQCFRPDDSPLAAALLLASTDAQRDAGMPGFVCGPEVDRTLPTCSPPIFTEDALAACVPGRTPNVGDRWEHWSQLDPGDPATWNPDGPWLDAFRQACAGDLYPLASALRDALGPPDGYIRIERDGRTVDVPIPTTPLADTIDASPIAGPKPLSFLPADQYPAEDEDAGPDVDTGPSDPTALVRVKDLDMAPAYVYRWTCPSCEAEPDRYCTAEPGIGRIDDAVHAARVDRAHAEGARLVEQDVRSGRAAEVVSVSDHPEAGAAAHGRPCPACTARAGELCDDLNPDHASRYLQTSVHRGRIEEWILP